MRALRRCWAAHPWIGSLLAPHTELAPAGVSVLDELDRTLAGVGLPAELVTREVEYVSRTMIGALMQEVRAPIPFAGLTDAVIGQLSEDSQPRWRAIRSALHQYGNDELFDDLVQANLLRLRRVIGSAGPGT
jgi:hypothetical protein